MRRLIDIFAKFSNFNRSMKIELNEWLLAYIFGYSFFMYSFVLCIHIAE